MSSFLSYWYNSKGRFISMRYLLDAKAMFIIFWFDDYNYEILKYYLKFSIDQCMILNLWPVFSPLFCVVICCGIYVILDWCTLFYVIVIWCIILCWYMLCLFMLLYFVSWCFVLRCVVLCCFMLFCDESYHFLLLYVVISTFVL